MSRVSFAFIILLASSALLIAADRKDQPARADDRDERSGGRPERVNESLRRRFPDATTEIYGEPRDVNGIRVFNIRIRTDRGLGAGMITALGDFFYAGVPVDFRSLPQDVRQLRDLLRTEPANPTAFFADGYYFDIRGPREGLFRVRYDALGRLREVLNPEQVDRYETTHFRKADESASRKIDPLARRHTSEDIKLKDVYQDPRYPDFYTAKYVNNRNGKEVLVTLDANDNVLETRTEIDMNDVPAPIRDSFDRMFDTSKVKWVYRTERNYYEFTQRTDRGDEVTFNVRPDGQVINVKSESATPEERAVTEEKDRRPADLGKERDRSR